MAILDTKPEKHFTDKGVNGDLEANPLNYCNDNIVKTGNAGEDQKDGWFIGRFMDSDSGMRCRDDIEIKWGVHPVGENRPGGWSLYHRSTTISILIEGRFTVLFRGRSWQQQVKLEQKGDYVIFAPGVEHSWISETDSVILTVRTPSIANDKKLLEY